MTRGMDKKSREEKLAKALIKNKQNDIKSFFASDPYPDGKYSENLKINSSFGSFGGGTELQAGPLGRKLAFGGHRLALGGDRLALGAKSWPSESAGC